MLTSCAHPQTPTRLLTPAARNTRLPRNGHARTSAGPRLRHTTRHSLRLASRTSTTVAMKHSSMEERLPPTTKHSDPSWCREPSRSRGSWLQWVPDTYRSTPSRTCDRTRGSDGCRPAISMDTAGGPSCPLRQMTGTGEAVQDTTTKQCHLSRTIRSLPTQTKPRMVAVHAVCRGRTPA